ncbi:histidine phosphatase family protein [Mesosutterella sp. OilRF-GAM-744-9]|uniref:Histidine phosphatase family protein n=1 Tax=Mesosutterella porci TaxID=2915351 RepID=A0ABS9MQV9_9BURK|nr:histidine phosphatase family protein [Mesosutterella sp. oilRF-744-WT-GAM-9]MCG5031015.1 histidine phosphatase family protein [Mesosutterella sp. oilRF-744-WT-GAM-9]
MLVYWLRHGETAWNRLGKIQGCADIPLDDEGRRQARETAAAISGVAFDRAFSSPLSRARETAHIVLQGRGPELQVLDDLHEVNFGSYDGRDMRRARSDPADPLYLWFHQPASFRPSPGGESLEQAAKRIRGVLERSILPLEGSAGRVFVAAHGSVTRILLTLLMGRPASRFQELSMKNCALSVLEVCGGRVRIVDWGRIFY